MIEWKRTERGFVRGEFRDRYGDVCSVQRSSIAFEDCLWLGLDEPKVMFNNMPAKLPPDFAILGRMHLDRERCAELGALLTQFAETGSLHGDPSEE